MQLRDNGFLESEAEEVMRLYVSRVPPTNGKGQHEPYTDREALDSLRQAFSRSAREPWALPTPVKSPATTNGHDHRTPPEPQLPIVVVNNRELRDASAEAIAALQRANVPPALFVRSGEMVTVRGDERTTHSNPNGTPNWNTNCKWRATWRRHSSRNPTVSGWITPARSTPTCRWEPF